MMVFTQGWKINSARYVTVVEEEIALGLRWLPNDATWGKYIIKQETYIRNLCSDK